MLHTDLSQEFQKQQLKRRELSWKISMPGLTVLWRHDRLKQQRLDPELPINTGIFPYQGAKKPFQTQSIRGREIFLNRETLADIK